MHECQAIATCFLCLLAATLLGMVLLSSEQVAPPRFCLHLKADVLPLAITIQPQYEPLALPSQLLQLLLEVGLVLHS